MLVRGGIGGRAVWGRSKTGSLLMKIGHSKTFNACNRVVEFHSRAPASFHSKDEEACAVLVHNFSGEPFESKETISKLSALGLAPSPALNDQEEGDSTDPETEEEDFLPRGPGLKVVGDRNKQIHTHPRMFFRPTTRHTN